MLKSVFSIMMLTKRLKTLPLIADRGDKGVAVARSAATEALLVAVLGTLTPCTEVTQTPARRIAVKDNILSDRELKNCECLVRGRCGRTLVNICPSMGTSPVI
jgi:hypothetical protein